MNTVEHFMTLRGEEDNLEAPPVISREGITYAYIKHNNVYRKFYCISASGKLGAKRREEE